MTERRRPSPASVGRADALRLLETDGCALCRAHDEAEETWLRWFGIEHHGDAGTLELLRSSLGFCPAHTRRLIALGEPPVLRQPWEFVLRAAVGRTERLITAGEAPSPARCPVCETAGRRAQAAGALLTASLETSEVSAVLRRHRGLCYPHLRHLVPDLSPARAGVAADAVHAAIAEAGITAAAGTDPDAEHRARWYPLVAEAPEPVHLPPAERLAMDLEAGSCPCCRQAGRAEDTYLTWLLEQTEPSDHDLRLCPRHLHDAAQRAAGPTRTVRVRCELLRARVAELAMAARHTGTRPRRRLRRSDRGHGLCLRHGEELARTGRAEAFLRRLLTRLRQHAWELNEDTVRQAWDLRHEPKGRETTTWRRVPTVLDGRAYLGLADSDLWP
ncbi:hypothetical protein [Actinoallomurus oryzae]